MTEMAAEEQRLLSASGRLRPTFASYVAWGGSALLLVLVLVLIGAAATMTSRDCRARQAQAWIRAGQMALGERCLARYLGAQVGAIYIAEYSGRFKRFASCAADPSPRR